MDSQRNIIISDFIQARSNEILHMQNSLNNKMLTSSKTTAQQLPRHMRRRAMSHNRYRIPSRVRGYADREMNKNEPKKYSRSTCRKHIRKPKLLACAYQNRHRQSKWLETHLWMAKRMRMQDYFNYKVAISPNDKSDRACYRFAKNNCVIYDKSYYQVIVVEGPSQTTIAQFFSNPIFTQQIYLKGLIKGRTIISYPNKNVLCDIEFMWKNEKELIILVHPGAKEELLQYLENLQTQDIQNISIKTQENKLNIFRMSGRESIFKLNLLLQQLQFENKNENKEFIDYFKSIQDPTMYPKGILCGLEFETEVKLKLVKEPLSKQNHPDHSYSQDNHHYTQDNHSYSQDNHSYSQNNHQFSQDNHSYSQDNHFFSRDKQNLISLALFDVQKLSSNQNIWQNILQQKEIDIYSKRFETIQRSRYTHKKQKNPPKMNQKQKNIKQSNQLSQKNDDLLQQQQENLVNANENMEIEQKSTKKIKFSVIIAFDLDKGFNNGFEIYCEQGVGIIIWRFLNFLNCKAIGLKEYQFLKRESNLNVFPDDYPSSQTFREKQIKDKKERIIKYFKKPPQKRINFVRISSPFPFSHKICQETSQLYLISYETLGRGSPDVLSYICLPTQDDLLILKSQMNTKQNEKVHTEPLNFQKVSLQNTHIEEYLNALENITTSRKILGQTLQGCFSFLQAKMKGVAQLSSCKQFFDENKTVFLLLRKTTSRYYFFIKCELIQ